MIEIQQEIQEHLHIFLNGLTTEYHDDQSAVHVIEKYLNKQPITPKDDLLLRTQLSDSLKMIGILIPALLIPGSSILLPLLIEVSEKYHIEILPKVFLNKKS